MMIDHQLMLDDANAITTSEASVNYIDLSKQGRDIGIGQELEVVFRVDTTFTATGSATLTIALQKDPTSTAFAGVSTVWQSAAIAVASLVAGYEVKARLPYGLDRYLRAYYTVATGPMTAGKMDAFIVSDAQAYKNYAAPGQA